MPIIDIFSKRQERARGESPDVFVYDVLPGRLRVQIMYILDDTLGDSEQSYKVAGLYKNIVHAIRKEHGVLCLVPEQTPGWSNLRRREQTCYTELRTVVLYEKDVELCLDAIELSFWAIDAISRSVGYLQRQDSSDRADEAIKELGYRFREHGVGYDFNSGRIIRVDSQFLHSEAVRPALQILEERRFSGAQDEFLTAHKHYRAGNTKECLSFCLSSLESVLKVICKSRRWPYSSNDKVSTLLQHCFDHGLIPTFWQNHYSSLRATLESGVPTGRNMLGSHGQGEKPVSIPEHLAAYMLHMTAAAIVETAFFCDYRPLGRQSNA